MSDAPGLLWLQLVCGQVFISRIVHPCLFHDGARFRAEEPTMQAEGCAWPDICMPKVPLCGTKGNVYGLCEHARALPNQ